MRVVTDSALRASTPRVTPPRLPQRVGGTMIGAMGPFRRAVRAVALALATSLAALPAFAEDDGWFDQPAERPAAPSTTATDRPALAPSPLLDRDPPPAAEDDTLDRDPRALTHWNDRLAPYGVWVDDPSYGRVWVPHSRVVGGDFAPYVSSGHWALDENDDWVWVSDYPFGGVVFHYGRWVWISGRGWAWIPGLRYAPAWVAWRTPVGGYGYVGWAPLPPAWIWFGGVSVVYGYGPYYPWVFCSSEYLFYPHVHHHIVRDRQRMTYAAKYTRPYHRTASARPVAAPRSPTVREANVPSHAVPRQRVRSERLAVSGSRRAAAADVAGSHVPAGQGRGSAVSSRAPERSPLVGGDRAPAVRRDASQPERRTPAERRDVTPSERRAPRLDARPPARERGPSFEQRRSDPPRSSPGRELRSAPRGRPRTNR
jgi:hypothetical protein